MLPSCIKGAPYESAFILLTPVLSTLFLQIPIQSFKRWKFSVFCHPNYTTVMQWTTLLHLETRRLRLHERYNLQLLTRGGSLGLHLTPLNVFIAASSWSPILTDCLLPEARKKSTLQC